MAHTMIPVRIQFYDMFDRKCPHFVNFGPRPMLFIPKHSQDLWLIATCTQVALGDHILFSGCLFGANMVIFQPEWGPDRVQKVARRFGFADDFGHFYDSILLLSPMGII